MTWFRLDDGFADHPKVLRCSLAAIGLWSKAGAWCAKHLTDGSVPSAAVSALGGSKRLADELVAADLWRREDGGYVFHEWLDHQPSRGQVIAKRVATRERVTAHRERSNAARNSVTNADCNTTPVPSRPVREEEEGHGVPKPLPISDEERAEADARANDPERRVVGHDAYVSWNLEAQQFGTHFDEHTFRKEWEAIALSCNATKKPRRALEGLCAWLWRAPDGPVGSARVKPSRMSPWRTGRALNEDLERAEEWFRAGGMSA